MTALSKKTPENMEYRRNLAVYETERARAQIKLGRYDEAQIIAKKVIEMMIPIAEADKETTTYQYDLAIAYHDDAANKFEKRQTVGDYQHCAISRLTLQSFNQ